MPWAPLCITAKAQAAEPTASAVIADLVDITRLHTADPLNRVPHLAFQPGAMSDLTVLPMSEVVTSYYLRLRVADQAGVLAKLTGLLAEADISIDAVLQREADQVSQAGRKPDRRDHPDPRHPRRHLERCAGPNASLAHRDGAHCAHSQGRVELMRYLSTRGHADRKQFCEILLEGLAPDGGLYLPESLPANRRSALTRLREVWQSQGYAALAFEVLSLYIDDIPRDDLLALCRKTYTPEVFGTQEIVPLKPLQAAGQAPARDVPGGLVQRPHFGLQRHGHAVAGQFV